MGRKKGRRYDIRIRLRLERGLYEDLRRVSEELDMSISELMRKLLRWFLYEGGVRKRF